MTIWGEGRGGKAVFGFQFSVFGKRIAGKVIRGGRQGARKGETDGKD